MQSLSVEHSDDTIRAGTEQIVFSRLTSKRPWHLDIHPFDHLSLSVVQVEESLTGEGKDPATFADLHSDENLLLLDFGKVGWLRLQDLHFFRFIFSGHWHASLLV